MDKQVKYSKDRQDSDIYNRLPIEVSSTPRSQKSSNISTSQLNYITHCIELFTTFNINSLCICLPIKIIAIEIFGL